MKHDKVQALNYCAHAIEDLLEFEKSIRYSAPMSAQVLKRLIDMLQNSVKFILPNCGELVDPESLRQSHLDLARLPFPCVAFEAPWEKEHGIDMLGGYQETLATKRIALCWEALPEFEVRPGLYNVLEDFPEGGVFLLAIFWTPESKKWQVDFGGVFLPYQNTFRELNMEDLLPASRIANAAAIEAGLAKTKSKQFSGEPVYLLPELFESAIEYLGNRQKALARLMMNSRDEALVFIQACSVINCANVTPADIEAPAALNKKRKANGKQPFFSYKVLQLADERRESGARDGSGGQHASPRMHLRRGHLRRLESKSIWVRPTMVNAESKRGAVFKDYAVKPNSWNKSKSSAN